MALGFADGSVHELATPVHQDPQWRTIIPSSNDAGAVQSILHDRTGDLWVLAGGAIQRVETLRCSWHAHWDEQPRMPVGNHDHIFARICDQLFTAGGKTFFGWPANEWANLDHIWSYHLDDRT